MITSQIAQTYRVECDRCGCGDYWSRSILEARTLAQRSGYRYSAWLQDGCARELWICTACQAEAETAADGDAVVTSDTPERKAGHSLLPE